MASSERVYEEFVPPYQMEREPATHTLTVNLSAQDYKKEHIRVQMVHSHRRLIVRGERPVGGGNNRWSRFRLELRVPDGCDAKAIRARFDNGVVRVTMPGLPPEPVPVVDSVTGTGTATATCKQQQPPSSSPTTPKQHASAAAVAGDDVRDGGGDGAAKRGQDDTPRKQEARQRVVSSANVAAAGDGSSSSGDDEGTASPPSSRQGYGFLLHKNRKLATTVVGVLLALISLGIYVKYSVSP